MFQARCTHAEPRIEGNGFPSPNPKSNQTIKRATRTTEDRAWRKPCKTQLNTRTSTRKVGNIMDSYSEVQVESVLRLRPLLKKEREDSVVLEPVKNVIRNAPATARLNPMNVPALSPRARYEPGSGGDSVEFHYNHVLPDTTSQDKMYYTIGLPMATSAMQSLNLDGKSKGGSFKENKNHVLVCLGVVSSGKTYSCFGGTTIPKRRAPQDGLVPRLLDSMFSQSKHHASAGKGGFEVQLSMLQISHCKGIDPYACQVLDLLIPKKKSSSPKGPITVRSMAAKFERALPSPIRSPQKSTEFAEVDADDPRPTVESCRDVLQARELLQSGLHTSKKFAKGQHHHIMITLQPVLDGKRYGDKITILDMAGLERSKRNQSRGKDSVANKNQAANAAVLHCLRTMIHNNNIRDGDLNPLDVVCADDAASEISCVSQAKSSFHPGFKTVPFRQHKVTMLMQPLFVNGAPTKVTLLVAAYPGHADYFEKKSLLQDIELLCGASLLSTNARVETGLEYPQAESVMTSESDSTSHIPARMLGRAPSGQRSPKKGSGGHNRTWEPPEKNETRKQHQDVHPSARTYRRTKLHRAHVRPSAPMAETIEPMPPPISPRMVQDKVTAAKETHRASDFPGVSMLSKSLRTNPIQERSTATTKTSSGMVGGPTAPYPPSPANENELNRPVPMQTNTPHDEGSRTFRKPLGRSSLENSQADSQSTADDTDRKSVARDKMRRIESAYAKNLESFSRSSGSRGSKEFLRRSTESSVPGRADEDVTQLEKESQESNAGSRHKEIRVQQVFCEDASTIESDKVTAAREGHIEVLFPSEHGSEEGRARDPGDVRSRSAHISRDVPSQSKNDSKGVRSRSVHGSKSASSRPEHDSHKIASRSARGEPQDVRSRSVHSSRNGPSRSVQNSQGVSSHSGHGSQGTRSRSDHDSQDSPSRSAHESISASDASPVRRLKRKILDMERERQVLAKKCQALEKENHQLKSTLRDVESKGSNVLWTRDDEEEFLRSRACRHEQQTLLKAPLYKHIEKVNYIYGVKNQWCMSSKPHFNLRLPGSFQSVRQLNVRDKENETVEMSKRAPGQGRDTEIGSVDFKTLSHMPKGLDTPRGRRQSAINSVDFKTLSQLSKGGEEKQHG